MSNIDRVNSLWDAWVLKCDDVLRSAQEVARGVPEAPEAQDMAEAFARQKRTVEQKLGVITLQHAVATNRRLSSETRMLAFETMIKRRGEMYAAADRATGARATLPLFSGG